MPIHKKLAAFFLLFLLFFYSYDTHLLSYDKWIVVTTIQYPTPQLRAMAKIPGWHLVVVGDKKTPKDWHLDNCDYLSPEKQKELGYTLVKLLPWNHYARKNIGYLYAIEHGATSIYETDDDNETINGLTPCSSPSTLPELQTTDSSVNVYAYFGHPEIWPRGFPLDKILHANQFQLSPPQPCFIGVEQGVVNESPDVDAIFRLTQDKSVEFLAKTPCSLPKGTFCPFNSQNTFFHPVAFFTLYLPSFVSMRVSDIWRGYISQRLLWQYDARLVFSGPSAVQKRNPHCLMNDFSQEQDLYLKGSQLLTFLNQWNYTASSEPFPTMTKLYTDLVNKGFLDGKELPLVKAWFHDLEAIGYPHQIQSHVKNT